MTELLPRRSNPGAGGSGTSLPDQTGNAGKVLGTDGTDPAWVDSGGSIPVTLAIVNSLTTPTDATWTYYDFTGLAGTGLNTIVEVDGADPTTLNVLSACDLTVSVIGSFSWGTASNFVGVKIELPAPIVELDWEPDPPVKDYSLSVRSAFAAGDAIRVRAYTDGGTGTTFRPSIVIAGTTI